MRLVWGRVTAISSTREEMRRLEVALPDGSEGSAVCYTALTGECAAGDEVLLNTTAADLALGTGGVHFVVARAARPSDRAGEVLDEASGGHIMKLRYTPLQRDVLAAEAPESPHHAALAAAGSVEGMPVVCCALHSQLPLAAAALKGEAPAARVAYVMTDEAALPLAFSDTAAACAEAGLIDASITCGQAFGGDLEAVNLHSGLLVARHVAGADAAIVAIGPGVVGTGTAFGHGGTAQGEAVNATVSVGGRAVAALRVSFADARERHRGVSHHSIVALTRVALASARIPVPALPPESAALVDDDLARAGVWARHERVDVPPMPLPDTRGVAAVSMGRGAGDDPAFFAAAAAAGWTAAAMLRDGRGPGAAVEGGRP